MKTPVPTRACRRVFPAWAPALVAALFLTSCLLDSRGDQRARPGAGETGNVVLNLGLERSRDIVLSKSAADTTFELDSLIIVLTAPGADTLVHRYPFAGRPDTGNIVLADPLEFELDALRNWKARIYSIDIRESPFRRDTVHLDSVTFGVLPTDTTFVSKTVSPAFSILRVRFLSSQADSIPNNVLYLRLRVDGETRDSVVLGGKNASLNWLQTLPGSTIFAAGDSGRILKSVSDAQTNDSSSWVETVVSTNPLVGGYFVDANNGYVVSVTGQTYVTTNGGNSWVTRATTADSLSGVYFTGTTTGFAIGRNGSIYKTANSANGWHTLVSNTTQHLNGISFPSADVGYVVGENETILKTENGSAPGGSAPEWGGVIWSPIAGGWFPQTSGTTVRVSDIHFVDSLWGWVVGEGGYVRRTVNGGATWLDRSGLNVSSPNAIWFSDSTKGYAVGANGTMSQYSSEWHWADRSASNGTSEHLYDVQFVGVDTGYVVGANGTLLRTINGSNTAWPGASWAQQFLPGSNDLAWFVKTSGTTNAFNALRFATATTGWAVGASGVIRRTTDAGETWTTQSGGTSTFHAVHARTASEAYAVGVSGTLRRTTDGGTNWVSVPTGVTTELRGVAANSGTVGWVVGASNVIRSTNSLNNATPTWTDRNVGTGDYNAINITGGRVWVVGSNGQVRRTGNLNHNSGFSQVGNANLGTTNLRGVYFLPSTNATGWVVGDGGFIARTTNGTAGNANNVTWTVQSAPTTENLTDVYFVDANIGYVTGASGTILKTTNGGTSWTLLSSGTSQALSGVHAISSDAVLVAGGNGVILKTTIGGTVPANVNHLRSVSMVGLTTAYVAGANGTIGKTVNAGGAWTLQASGTTQTLNGISFVNANVGWAVGNTGTILKTVNGGGTWSSQTSGTTQHLLSVRAISADVAYASGNSGVVLKTVDGGATWYQQETPVTQNLGRVHFQSAGNGFVVGEDGTILKAGNGGDNWTGGGIKRSLKGVHFANPDTGWIVGADGVILNTRDGGNSWTLQHQEDGLTLYGIYFANASTGWASGENGRVLKTVNGGNTWVPQASGTDVTLRWIHFRDANRGFIIGGTESILETSDGGSDWSGLFVGVPGQRTFDRTLSWKYLKPNQSNQVILEAVDRFSQPMRGYQSVINLTVGAGQDSTLVSPMTRCGYDPPNDNCLP